MDNDDRTIPNDQWVTPNDGDVTGRGIDCIGEFLEIYSTTLGFSRRFRPDDRYNEELLECISKTREKFDPKNYSPE